DGPGYPLRRTPGRTRPLGRELQGDRHPGEPGPGGALHRAAPRTAAPPAGTFGANHGAAAHHPVGQGGWLLGRSWTIGRPLAATNRRAGPAPDKMVIFRKSETKLHAH